MSPTPRGDGEKGILPVNEVNQTPPGALEKPSGDVGPE
jgi:hypothetical protein